MNEPTKIIATIGAWLSPYHDVAELTDYIAKGQLQRAAGIISYSAHNLGGTDAGAYTKVGDAEITVTLFSRDELTRVQLDALNRQLEEARLAFAAKQSEILERISKLSALEYVEA